MNARALQRTGPALPLLLMLALLVLASAVRFHRLGEQSLWYDEGVAYNHALRTLPELIPLLQRNVHVPAYFTLLGLWEDVAGASEFALRSLSAFFSLLSVALTFALGARLFHPAAGLAASAFVALNTFSIYYAAEARMYAMLTAIAAGSMLLFVVFLGDLCRPLPSRSRNRYIIALGLINALGLYTHVVYALILLTQSVLALVCFGGSWRTERQATGTASITKRALLAYSTANILTLLLFSPWVSTAVRQVFAQPNIAAPVALDRLLREIQGYLAFGSTFEFSMGDMGLVVYFFLLFGLILPETRGRALWHMLLPLAWVLISVGVYLSMNLGARYMRFLLPAQLAFALWMGRGAWILWTRRTRDRCGALRHIPKLAALVASAGLLLAQFKGLPILYHHSDFQRDDMRGLVRHIEGELNEGDALIVSAAGLAEVLRYYYRAEAPVYGLPVTADVESTRAQVSDIIAAHERLHVIFYGAAEQDPEGIVEAALNRNAFEISDVWVGDLRYAQYVSPADFAQPQPLDARFGKDIVLQSAALSAQEALPGAVLQVQFTWIADAAVETRYKVFLQLLDADGFLVAQRDSEPGGGLAKTINWQPGVPVLDNHALSLPNDLSPGGYRLIAGLYDINDATARLPVGEADYLELARIRVS
ncbi:MAG: glycosyltransferase family 39 protein [Chloroflexi bacterium]|nr:glycosyltransferase family 39 protein [Chloroflexota bacterium]